VIKVVGLDLSTCTGLAVIVSGGIKPSVHHTEVVQFKKLNGWPRVNAIACRIMEVVEQEEPDCVALEGYGFGQMASVVTLAEIGSVVRFLLWQEDIPFLDIPPSSLKKFVTGKGNAKKDQMILEVYKHYGYTSKTNDIADAIGLGMFGLCAMGVKFPAGPTKCVNDVLKSDKNLVNFAPATKFKQSVQLIAKDLAKPENLL